MNTTQSHPDPLLVARISRLVNVDRPRLQRLWAYYRNALALCPHDATNGSRPYRQAQEWGLPARITGKADPRLDSPTERKEIVIENDIRWRIDTMVDYLFGKPFVLESGVADPARREELSQLLRLVLDHNGGLLLLQQIALLGAVYGFVDVMVKLLPAPDVADPASPPDSIPPAPARLMAIARRVRIEVVEPTRSAPVLHPEDFRIVEAYAQHYVLPGAAAADASEDEPAASWWQRMLQNARQKIAAARPIFDADRPTRRITDVVTATRWQRFEDDRLVASGENSLGRIPLVHIQNTAVPFEYAGASDVEPLVPLQDELNTRLSDRANRLALQSFKMYLGIGIENFADMPVSPGRMWMSDNERASVQEFGGDSDAPSEKEHIAEIREAMDKASGVTPIAAGAIKNRIGRLTSAAALRVTLISLLSRTEKKRTNYGAGIAAICELALAWLDKAGLFATRPDEREIQINWPNPLPANESERLQEAEAKLRVGVDPKTVLRELGY